MYSSLHPLCSLSGQLVGLPLLTISRLGLLLFGNLIFITLGGFSFPEARHQGQAALFAGALKPFELLFSAKALGGEAFLKGSPVL